MSTEKRKGEIQLYRVDKINIKNMIAEKNSIVDKSHTSLQKNRGRGNGIE